MVRIYLDVNTDQEYIDIMRSEMSYFGNFCQMSKHPLFYRTYLSAVICGEGIF